MRAAVNVATVIVMAVMKAKIVIFMKQKYFYFLLIKS